MIVVAFGLAIIGHLFDRVRRPLARLLNEHWRPAADPLSAHPLYLQASVNSNWGATARAVALANAALQALESTVTTSNAPWLELNNLVNVYINAGAYERALSCTDAWAPGANSDRVLDINLAVILINHAEALHNLGRDLEALSYLEKVEARIDNEFALAGLQLLRAWILLHRGDLIAAKVQMDGCNLEILANAYAPEIAFTQAALMRESREYELALTTIEQGLGEAKRASSLRNGLIMQASVYAAKSDHATALGLFEQAFAMPYKAQAAYGILRLAELQRQTQGITLDRQNDVGPYQIDYDSLPEEFRAKWQGLDPESRLSMWVYPKSFAGQ